MEIMVTLAAPLTCTQSSNDREKKVVDSVYRTRAEARQDIIGYREIEMLYSGKRRHHYLGYLSPKNFEKQMALKKAA